MLTTAHRKDWLCYETKTCAPGMCKMDMRFGTWNVRNLYRSGSLTIARELARYKLVLVGVQEVR